MTVELKETNLMRVCQPRRIELSRDRRSKRGHKAHSRVISVDEIEVVVRDGKLSFQDLGG